jgi:hypothetical protein
MKKTILSLILFITAICGLNAQSNLAEVNKINGFYIFVDSKPTADYDVVGEVKADETDKDIIRSQGQYSDVRDNIIKNARMANYQADGLIFTFINGGTDKALIIKFKQDKPENKIAKVEQYIGLYVFTDCTPLLKYDYLDTQKFSGGFSSGQYTSVRDTLIKRVKKKIPNANAVIFKLVSGGNDLADGVRIN